MYKRECVEGSGEMSAGRIGRVAIVGSGLMGTGIAAEYAAAEHEVSLYVRSEAGMARARERTRTALAALASCGALRGDVDATLAGLRFDTSLDAAVAGAEMIVESIPESRDLKHGLFAYLEGICPEATILASNTSGIPITQIAAGLAHPERVIGTHYLNPPHLMPPVEVIPGEQTDPAITARVRETLAAMGKSPVVVGVEAPGFLWNRLQYAILREACHIVESGIATMEEVDLVMRQGLARRWSVVGGPFASLDLGGIGTTAVVGDYLFPALSNATETPRTITEPVSAGRTGAESGAGFYDWPDAKRRATLAQRDAALAALRRADMAEGAG